MSGYAERALVGGLSWLAHAQTAIANNLANVATDGFKRRTPVADPLVPTFADQLDARLPAPSYAESIDVSPGLQRPTNENLHVAIDGDGFFRVRSRTGEDLYTRRGELHVDPDGFLASTTGDRFVDPAGTPIRIGDATDLRIAANGEITGEVDDGRDRVEIVLGQLGVVRFEDPSVLQPFGTGRFADTSGHGRAAVPDPAQVVRQGVLEQSNVESLTELVQMISVQRTFQATARALGTVGRIHESFVTAMTTS